jgi:hypothetical protein
MVAPNGKNIAVAVANDECRMRRREWLVLIFRASESVIEHNMMSRSRRRMAMVSTTVVFFLQRSRNALL